MTIKKRSARPSSQIELDTFWGDKAKRIIKSKMALCNVSAKELAEILTDAGRPSTAQGVRNMLGEAKFKAAWFLHVKSLLEALEKNS